jgi:hypothetical protein
MADREQILVLLGKSKAAVVLLNIYPELRVDEYLSRQVRDCHGSANDAILIHLRSFLKHAGVKYPNFVLQDISRDDFTTQYVYKGERFRVNVKMDSATYEEWVDIFREDDWRTA